MQPAALIPAQGKAVIVTPYFEEPSICETLQIEAAVRTWKEDESPLELLAVAMREHRALAGTLAVESTTRFFVWERLGKALNGARQRELWKTVKRGQEIALETAKPGVPVGSIDKAVRALREPRLEQGLSIAGAVAPHRPRHRHACVRGAVSGAQ